MLNSWGTNWGVDGLFELEGNETFFKDLIDFVWEVHPKKRIHRIVVIAF